ncbi:tRNA (guanosine(46)-N7)-methyltransferase TrmB [Idiomarina tyrosinivorans]|uniref:tRNA (guanine-N(7)-)-methyltransferase n=1 Tax=Idiomarina tyrosinivorans TaxID=1445662 RepID=A0A432ZJH3_9GAMM|nr:tRNA (guanosine(46)-N7)-methyltransferase TrmB [Idiomarina tyrosinivorans]RUO78175.1 tRNA (guanosine(46)-N7)-methyltransferase TrmB [Idiomarina tyrosinivorans]
MSQFRNAEEAAAAGKYVRTVRSFVKREGRLTKGQASAIERLWPTMGLAFSERTVDLLKLFGREGPVTLEIGFGMGGSLVEMAAADPQRNFIGIEVHEPGVGACLMAAEQAQVTNLRVSNSDAVEVLKQQIPDHSLDRVQIFFPDPWHKKRHHKRRLIQPQFIQLLLKKLRAGGMIHLATDWENYAEHMLEVLSAEAKLTNLSHSGDFVPRPADRPKTKFEQRGKNKGHGVWDLQFVVARRD